MRNIADTLTGLVFVAVATGFVLANHPYLMPSEAVLGEVAMVIHDLESELATVEHTNGVIPRGVDLGQLMRHSPATAIIGKPGDPPLMPELSEENGRTLLGGCPADIEHWSVLRMDHALLTGIPDRWEPRTVKVCLDRNGANGPNREGYDVIWLAFSRTGSPHITLIPSGAERI